MKHFEKQGRLRPTVTVMRNESTKSTFIIDCHTENILEEMDLNEFEQTLNKGKLLKNKTF
jgi:hypothetical protein